MSSIARSALWVTISEIIFNLSGFIIHSVLGRILGPGDYGRYSLIITLTTMVIILIGNGIPTAMAKYISEIFETDPKMVAAIKKKAIVLQSAVIGAITLIFFFSAPLIAKALNDETLTPLFRLSTLIIPAFAGASFYFSYFTGLHRFNLQATLKTFRSFLRIGFVIALAYFFGVKGSIIGYVLAPAAIFFAAYAIDKFKVTPELKANEKRINADIGSDSSTISFDWRVLINYAWKIVVLFLAYELLISIDLYMVKGILQNDALTGIYNSALTVGRIPYYLFYALTIFLLPMISKASAQNKIEEAGRIITQAVRIMLLLLVPMIILLTVFSEQILRMLYGDRFLQGAFPMSILVFGVGFLTVFYVLSFALNGAGKTKISMSIAFVGLLTNIMINYLLIPKYALAGAAVATTTASFVSMLLIIFYLSKDFKISVSAANLLKVGFSGALMYAVGSALPGGNSIFIFWSLILTLGYFGLLKIFGEITEEDLGMFKKVLNRNKA
ncbi:MAG TPA: hypothetical protein DIT25_01480 [Candidatus Moranbacteria bacterium]|nr:hypothetical protein [Candidatus Moranbacteria bacterium]